MSQNATQSKRALEDAKTSQASKQLRLSPKLSSVNNINNAAVSNTNWKPGLSAQQDSKLNGCTLAVPSVEVKCTLDSSSFSIMKEPQQNMVVLSEENTKLTTSNGKRVPLEQSESHRDKENVLAVSGVNTTEKTSTIKPPPSSAMKPAKKLVHLPDGRKACPECDVIKKNLIELLIHLKEVHINSERPYSCPHSSCQRFFVEKEDVERHFQEEHGLRTRYCKRCFCIIKTTVKEHCRSCSKVVHKNPISAVEIARLTEKAKQSGQRMEFLMPPRSLPPVVRFPNGFMEDRRLDRMLKPEASFGRVGDLRSTPHFSGASLKDWLLRIGISNCATALHEEGVENLEQLLELTDQDIVEIARTHKWKLLHRRRLLTERSKLVNLSSTAIEARSNSRATGLSLEHQNLVFPPPQSDMISPYAMWDYSLPPLEIVPSSTPSILVPPMDMNSQRQLELIEQPFRSLGPEGLAGSTIMPNTFLRGSTMSPEAQRVHLPDGRKGCPECLFIAKNLIELLLHLTEKHKGSGLPINCPRKGCPRFFVLQEDVDKHFLEDHLPKAASNKRSYGIARRSYNDARRRKEKNEQHEKAPKGGSKTQGKRITTPTLPNSNQADIHAHSTGFLKDRIYGGSSLTN